jgi:hypothetical protein
LRVSPKAWAAVENVRLPVDDDRGRDSAVARVGRRRPTADDDDLGYIGCRIVSPIRIAERRPFGAAGGRLVLDYLLGNCRIEQEKSCWQREYQTCMSIHRSPPISYSRSHKRAVIREIEKLLSDCPFAKIFYADCGSEATRAESPARSCCSWVNSDMQNRPGDVCFSAISDISQGLAPDRTCWFNLLCREHRSQPDVVVIT